ncbi:MAG: hypothetical protein P8Z31_06905 [Gammaproteobacteria bacterium]
MNGFAADTNEQRDVVQHGIRLLADREHSRLELRRKLLALDYDPGIVEEALQIRLQDAFRAARSGASYPFLKQKPARPRISRIFRSLTG